MICDLTLNDELILSGQRILGSSPIIPYRHLQQNGNFLLLSDGDEIPFWDRFDIDQQLVYLSYNEIIAIPVPDPDRPVFVPYQRNQIIINSLAFVI